MLTRNRLAAALSTLVVALSACNLSPESDFDRYQRARARWERVDTGNYEMTISIGSQVVEGLLVVTVRDGAVTSARGALDGKPLEGWALAAVPTVDDIFDQIRDAFREEHPTMKLEFDRLLGYPSSVYLDLSERWADDEVGYQIHQLRHSAVAALNASPRSPHEVTNGSPTRE